jgi:hypothetical protein
MQHLRAGVHATGFRARLSGDGLRHRTRQLPGGVTVVADRYPVRSQLSVNDQCGRQQTKCQNVPLLKRIIQPAAPAGQQHNRVGEVLLQPGDKFAPLVNVVDQGLSVTHYTPKTSQ